MTDAQKNIKLCIAEEAKGSVWAQCVEANKLQYIQYRMVILCVSPCKFNWIMLKDKSAVRRVLVVGG
jgi:hypothetical protein